MPASLFQTYSTSPVETSRTNGEVPGCQLTNKNLQNGEFLREVQTLGCHIRPHVPSCFRSELRNSRIWEISICQYIHSMRPQAEPHPKSCLAALP